MSAFYTMIFIANTRGLVDITAHRTHLRCVVGHDILYIYAILLAFVLQELLEAERTPFMQPAIHLLTSTLRAKSRKIFEYIAFYIFTFSSSYSHNVDVLSERFLPYLAERVLLDCNVAFVCAYFLSIREDVWWDKQTVPRSLIEFK